MSVTSFGNISLFGGAYVIERQLRRRLMRHFLKMTPTFYEKNKTGDLMARSTNDLRAISETAGFGIMTLVDSTLYLCHTYLNDGIPRVMEIDTCCAHSTSDIGLFDASIRKTNSRTIYDCSRSIWGFE